jgi:hypothetical protein
MPTDDFNKKLVDCRWLTMLAHYVYYVYNINFNFINTYSIFIYTYIVLCFIINCEKISHNYFKNGYKINALGIVQILDLEEIRTQQHKD